MSQTLLQRVNWVRAALREDRVTVVDLSDELTQNVVDIVNVAGREVFAEALWPFNIRTDGLMPLFATEDGTGADLTINPYTVAAPTIDSTRLRVDASDFSHGNLNVAFVDIGSSRSIWRVQMSGAGQLLDGPGHRVEKVEKSGADIRFLFDSPGRQPFGNESKGISQNLSDVSWTAFSYEYILDDTVGEILSARDEQTPLSLEFMDRHTDLYNVQPQIHQSPGLPATVYIMGSGSSTWTEDDPAGASVGAQVTGRVMAVWPRPETRRQVRFDYEYLHPAQSDTEDTFVSVPDTVGDIINRLAVIRALEGTLGNRPEDALKQWQVYQRDIERLKSRVSNPPYRRYRPTPYGGSSGLTHYRARWASQTIEAP